MNVFLEHPLIKKDAVEQRLYQIDLAQLALRWILEFPAVTCAIPGAKRPEQVRENLAAAGLPPLSKATMKKIGAIYSRQIKPLVHQYW